MKLKQWITRISKAFYTRLVSNCYYTEIVDTELAPDRVCIVKTKRKIYVMKGDYIDIGLNGWGDNDTNCCIVNYVHYKFTKKGKHIRTIINVESGL